MQLAHLSAVSGLLFAAVAVTQPALAQNNGNNNNNGGTYNWSGFYGGGNLGGAFGGSDFASANGQGLPCLECQTYPGIAISGNPAVIAAYSSSHGNSNSLTGGLQFGYNVWAGGILVGFEADANLLKINPSTTRTAQGQIPGPTAASPGTPGGTVYTFHNEIEADYIATARTRIGVPVGSGIVFATGGLAMTSLTYSHSMRTNGGPFAGLTEDASAHETKVGWTAGGGYELPIARNVTMKAEYLFTKFGDVTTDGNKISPLQPVPLPFGNIGGALEPIACGVDTMQVAPTVTPRQCFKHQADLLLHTIRLGLNFKF